MNQLFNILLVKDVPTVVSGWQNMASPIGEELVYFHDLFMWLAITICASIILLVIVIHNKSLFSIRFFNHNYFIEVVWTIVPALILLALSYPSFKLLYMMDDFSEPSMVIKAIGHQWYWSYEINDDMEVMFDSYMIPTEDLQEGFRLLEVDNRLFIPWANSIRLIVTSSDVIHSWAMPSLGIKLDAVPGRLNSVVFHCNRIGLFYGQCSELCGTNHAFMPIVLEVSSLQNYYLLVKTYFNCLSNTVKLPQLDITQWFVSCFNITLSLWIVLIIINLHMVYLSSYFYLLNESNS